MRLFLSLLSVFTLVAVPGGLAQDQGKDEAVLRGANVPTDGPGLVAFFRNRSAKTEADEKRIEALIEKLGTARFREREQAVNELLAIGAPAKLLLKKATEHKDPEVRRRAEECLKVIEAKTGPDVELAALRVLKARNPAGGCGAVLLYLPSVRDPVIEEEAFATLLHMASRGGKVDDDLIAALKDRDPVRRAAAVMFVGKFGDAGQQAQVRTLLKQDAEAMVRLRAAQGLVAARDREALAGLMPLLTDAPLPVAEQALELLQGLAGEQAPTSSLGENATTRRACRTEWETWWRDHGKALDLAKADVEVPWQNANVKVRGVVTEFLRAMEKGDAKALKKVFGVPFCAAGQIVIETQEQLDQLFAQVLQGIAAAPQKPMIEIERIRVLTVKQSLTEVANPMTAEFLKKQPEAEVRVLIVSAKQAGNPKVESGALIVRVRKGQAQIIGLDQVNPK
jgi:hypothetical protein